jgi:hypothetical protein
MNEERNVQGTFLLHNLHVNNRAGGRSSLHASRFHCNVNLRITGAAETNRIRKLEFGPGYWAKFTVVG